MGPVFGLQDDSVSVGADTSMSGGGVVVEAWLVSTNNKYYNGSTWKNFGSGSIGKPQVGKTYKFKVVGLEDTVTIYVDGVEIVKCKIDDHFMEGRFGIMLRNSVVKVDNVRLQRYLPIYEIEDKESDVISLRVASFNIGDFSTDNGSSGDGIALGNGTETTKGEYRAVFERVDADLWGLQEDSQYFNGTTKESPYDAIYSNSLPNYKRNFTGTYNGKGFLSGYKVYDVEAVYYNKVVTSYSDGQLQGYSHPWFLAGKVMIDSKEITVISIHLEHRCKEQRAQQIKDLIDYATKQEYCIILGDFNPENKINSQPAPADDPDYVNGNDSLNMYQIDWAEFTEAGLIHANGGEFGAFATLMNEGNARSPYPWDNIIVTPNITITGVEVVTEKWMNDHAIVVADLEIR